MTVNIVSGNLFESDANYLVNAVNCVGVMGGGIARTFAQKYPDYLADYKTKCEVGDINIGAVDIYKYIVSFPTMYRPGSASKSVDIHVGLADLRAKLEENLSDLSTKPNFFKYNATHVAMPALGCGVGGLDFRKLISMVDMVFADHKSIHIDLYAPWVS